MSCLCSSTYQNFLPKTCQVWDVALPVLWSILPEQTLGEASTRRCWAQCGLGCVVLAACVVPLMGAVQEAVAPEVRSPARVGFHVSPSCSDDFESLVEPLRGLWALSLENKSPFSPRYKWQTGVEAEPSKACFVDRLSECVSLLPLTNGNKTDKSLYTMFDKHLWKSWGALLTLGSMLNCLQYSPASYKNKFYPLSGKNLKMKVYKNLWAVCYNKWVPGNVGLIWGLCHHREF